MTEYSDVPKANQLYSESQNIKTAIEHIDAGGNITTFTVYPPPQPPYNPSNPTPPPALGVSVIITTQIPNDPALLAAVRADLIAREQAIAVELQALDVTYQPPTRT